MGEAVRGKGRNNPEQDRRYQSSVDRIWHRFSPDELARVCQMSEESFPTAYGLEVFDVEQRAPSDWYAFRDNGSDILAVAHLDTVGEHEERRANFVDTEAGWVVFSRALDDRLGAYTILELLPKLGLKFDVLLTVGEEQGQSTAAFFETSKQYKWIIEFDRGGTDVVLYQYETVDLEERVKASGARVGQGSFSDVSYLSHVGSKGINWGVGYRDYHGPRAHAFLDDYAMMIAYFLEFHRTNQGVTLPHDEDDELWGGRSRGRVGGIYGYGSGSWWDDDEDDKALAAKWGSGADVDEDDRDDDLRFEQWLRDHPATYSPDATCPGVPTPRDPAGDLLMERIAAIKAGASATSIPLPLPGLDA